MELIHILLAEDESQLAQILHDTLTGEGFCVTTAQDGVEALDLYGQEHPDILVVDVMMPRMDGFELVRRIRRGDQQTPVLFLTARSATEDVVAGFELGADDYLKKPFGMRELIVRVQHLVRQRIVQGGSTSEGSPHVPDVGQNDFFNKSHGWAGQARRESPTTGKQHAEGW